MSVTGIAGDLGGKKSMIGRYSGILLIPGRAEMRAYGMAKVLRSSPKT